MNNKYEILYDGHDDEIELYNKNFIEHKVFVPANYPQNDLIDLEINLGDYNPEENLDNDSIHSLLGEDGPSIFRFYQIKYDGKSLVYERTFGDLKKNEENMNIYCAKVLNNSVLYIYKTEDVVEYAIVQLDKTLKYVSKSEVAAHFNISQDKLF